jgi:AMP-binding enzyme C-terminal domain
VRAHASADRALLGPGGRHARRARGERLPERDRGRRARGSAARGHYAIVVDRRAALPELEVRAEVADASVAQDEAAERLRRRLADRLLLRVAVVVGPAGSIPRQELGKAQRVFERLDERDPLGL